MSGKESKFAFFKQSGWMVIATVVCGAFMTLVHTVVIKVMQPSEYALFASLLKVFLLLGIPAGGLQTVFAQQAASALDERHHRELSATTRTTLGVMFGIWLAIGFALLLMRDNVSTALRITSFPALGFTILLGLPSLWVPVFKGLLQGTQNFAGLGWLMMLDGVVRLSSVILLVLILKGQSASAMAAALLGQAAAITIGGWFTRDIWRGKTAPFDWKLWMQKVIPLTIGSASITIISLFDTLFVQNTFDSDEKRAFYMAGWIVGFALAQFTLPLSVVMFSKIARSAARAEKTDALAMTLKSTLALGGLAALVCTFIPTLPLRIVYFTKYEQFKHAAPLVPWFAWCLLIFAMANVLVNNLLARQKFAIVPWLAAIACAYGITLVGARSYLLSLDLFNAFRLIVQMLMGYSLLLLLISMHFTWPRTKVEPPPAS